MSTEGLGGVYRARTLGRQLVVLWYDEVVVVGAEARDACAAKSARPLRFRHSSRLLETGCFCSESITDKVVQLVSLKIRREHACPREKSVISILFI